MRGYVSLSALWSSITWISSKFFPSPASQQRSYKWRMEKRLGRYSPDRSKALSLLRSNRSSRGQWLPMSLLVGGPGEEEAALASWSQGTDSKTAGYCSHLAACLTNTPCCPDSLSASGGFIELEPRLMGSRGQGEAVFPISCNQWTSGNSVPTSECPQGT